MRLQRIVPGGMLCKFVQSAKLNCLTRSTPVLNVEQI
jgi:hypothetical protein